MRAARGRLKPWALVPIKESSLAKQRLSAFLCPQWREALFAAMIADVFATLAACTSLKGFAVVTVDPSAQKLAHQHGGLVIQTGARSGYNEAVRLGTRELVERHAADAVLTLPMDVPLITTRDIEDIISAPEYSLGGFTLVPSRDFRGTNATLSSPPGCVGFRFGDDSFAAHLKSAKAVGIRPFIVNLSNVALDIDYPEDVRRLLAIPRETRTHAVLADARFDPGAFRTPVLHEARAAR